MNNREKKMLDILIEGRKNFGFLAVKAEFEAEGTRTDEFLRLLEIARRAQVKVGLKIGGCEAIRDLIECKQFGVDYIIAPMVETAYALKKYIDAKNKVFALEEQSDIKFLFNVETITAYENLNEMIALSKIEGGPDGIVFGRVDFMGSMGKDRKEIESPAILKYLVDASKRCEANNIELVVGGAISPESLPNLRILGSNRLDRFETRKVIFSSSVLEQQNAEKALLLAVEFELLWLENKRDYYALASVEDEQRIALLNKRFNGPIQQKDAELTQSPSLVSA